MASSSETVSTCLWSGLSITRRSLTLHFLLKPSLAILCALLFSSLIWCLVSLMQRITVILLSVLCSRTRILLIVLDNSVFFRLCVGIFFIIRLMTGALSPKAMMVPYPNSVANSKAILCFHGVCSKTQFHHTPFYKLTMYISDNSTSCGKAIVWIILLLGLSSRISMEENHCFSPFPPVQVKCMSSKIKILQ